MLKAPERPCKGCGATIPAQPSGPGRPREFCQRRCRRDFFHRKEREELERERIEEGARRRYEMDRRYYGKRKADQLRRQRERAR